MSDICKKCEVIVTNLKDGWKCTDCSGIFHPQCIVNLGEKRNNSRRNWKCEGCYLESASSASRPGSESAASVLEAIAAFRDENNTRWDKSDTKLTALQTDVNKLVSDVGELKCQYESLKVVVDGTVSDVGELRSENARLAREITFLKDNVADLQQQTRKNNIIISGVPKTTNENVFFILDNMARLLNLNHSRDDISAAHRLPAPRGDSARPPNIVVCFVSRAVKGFWLQARKDRKTLSARELHASFPDQPVWLNDHLTQENAELFREARQLRRDNKLAAVWTSDGRVLIKRTPTSGPMRVASLRALSSFRTTGEKHTDSST